LADIIATPDDVRAAYRLILGRDPDASGLAHYLELIADRTVMTSELCSMFIASSEFTSGHESTVDIGGATLVVDPTEREFGQHIARHATWEKHIVAIIRNSLSPGQVFVDVGANVGVMSLNAAIVVGPKGKVISFEPDERNARLFLRGVFESKFQDFVRLHHFALSDAPGIFSLAGSSNTYLIKPSNPSRLVQSVCGDDILLHEPRVDLMKLDIEGYEPFAIRGLEQTIRKHRPLILCEFNPRCLTDHAGVPPALFAEQIFELTCEAEAVEYDGRTSLLTTPASLMSLWNAKNDEATRTGLLPPGMLHFDLFFRANPR
jgi:FkbM family methyltransferase